MQSALRNEDTVVEPKRKTHGEAQAYQIEASQGCNTVDFKYF